MELGTLPDIRCSGSPRRPPQPPIPSESGPTVDPNTAGIPKSPQKDKGRPLLPSTTSSPSKNGSKDDPDKISPPLMDEP